MYTVIAAISFFLKSPLVIIINICEHLITIIYIEKNKVKNIFVFVVLICNFCCVKVFFRKSLSSVPALPLWALLKSLILLFQWLSLRGPLQPPEFRRLGWSSLRPEPLSFPPFVLKTSLQNNDFKPMHSQKVLVLHFHMFFTFPNGCHFRFSTQTSNELSSRSACYSDDTQGNPLFIQVTTGRHVTL